jgi:hypothetical protein
LLAWSKYKFVVSIIRFAAYYIAEINIARFTLRPNAQVSKNSRPHLTPPLKKTPHLCMRKAESKKSKPFTFRLLASHSFSDGGFNLSPKRKL